ncbi:hypothetical protein J6590_102104 [Homalodisca vitripennis]|nr:hypothetical protein J6590_102104 [Homalodisca vitripennis]
MRTSGVQLPQVIPSGLTGFHTEGWRPVLPRRYQFPWDRRVVKQDGTKTCPTVCLSAPFRTPDTPIRATRIEKLVSPRPTIALHDVQTGCPDRAPAPCRELAVIAPQGVRLPATDSNGD